MVALIALVLILAVFGGLGFAVHFLWIVLVVALLLWVVGFFVGTVESGIEHATGRGRGRRWYGR
jgi:energy-coupling factor transporter transmembrane protein EcfT